MPSAQHMFVVNVIGWVQKEDKFLFIQRMADDKHEPNSRHIPGGKIDYAQLDGIIEQTLQREIEEETGVKVDDNMRYLGSKACMFGEFQVLTIIFLTQRKSGEAYAREEVQNVGWFTREELADMKKHGLLEKAYEALKRNQK